MLICNLDFKSCKKRKLVLYFLHCVHRLTAYNTLHSILSLFYRYKTGSNPSNCELPPKDRCDLYCNCKQIKSSKCLMFGFFRWLTDADLNLLLYWSNGKIQSRRYSSFQNRTMDVHCVSFTLSKCLKVKHFTEKLTSDQIHPQIDPNI